MHADVGARASQHAELRLDLAAAFLCLGECAEAPVLLRTTLAARICTVGPDDEGTLITEKQRRIYGRYHLDTLSTSSNLSVTLSEQDKHAYAVEIEREVLVSTARLLDSEH